MMAFKPRLDLNLPKVPGAIMDANLRAGRRDFARGD